MFFKRLSHDTATYREALDGLGDDDPEPVLHDTLVVNVTALDRRLQAQQLGVVLESLVAQGNRGDKHHVHVGICIRTTTISSQKIYICVCIDV